MAYGELGPTHHSVEDLSWLRALPGLDIMVPADRQQTRQAIRSLVERPRPAFMRVGRHKVPDVTPEDASWERGRFTMLRDGNDVTLIGTGTLVSRALAAAEQLELDGISARVLNAAWIAPFDDEAVLDAAHHTRAIVVAEEANVSGGLGAAVASLVAQQPAGSRPPVRLCGLTEFAPTGSTDFLLEYFGLTGNDIARAAREAMVHG